MKQIILLFFVILSFNITAQTTTNSSTINPLIKSELQVDSSRLLTLTVPNIDAIQKKMYLTWGAPNTNLSGEMIWKGVNIGVLGQNVTVVVYDGLETTQNGVSYYKEFPNGVSKYNILKDLQQDQQRMMKVGFFSSEGVNLINTKVAENEIVNFLTSFL